MFGDFRRASEDVERRPTGAYHQSDRLRSILRSLAVFYLQSNPGADTIAFNVAAHMRIWQASQGQLPRHEFDRVLDELLYRLGAIKQGEDYARQLGLGFMPAGEFNDQVWLRDHPHLRTSRRFAWSEIVSRGSELFPSPPPNVDLAYYKLQAYLAAAFASAGRDEALISSSLEGLVEGKSCGTNLKEL